MHHVAAAERGQATEDDCEEIDQENADQEGRQRYAYERHRLEEPGERAVAMQRSIDAHRDACRERQDRGDERELERSGHARADEIRDRLLELVRDPEIEPRRMHEKTRGLDDRGLVEAKLMAELRAVLNRGLDPDHLVHGIADIAEHREGDQPDRDQDADRSHEAAQYEGDHGRSRGRAWPRLAPAGRHARIGVIPRQSLVTQVKR